MLYREISPDLISSDRPSPTKQINFSGISWDFLRTFYGILKTLPDFQKTFSGISQNFMSTFPGLSQGFIKTFHYFLKTFLGLSQYFLITFYYLFRIFFRIFSNLFQDFLRIFSGLSQDFLKNFSGFSKEFPRTLSGLYHWFLRTSRVWHWLPWLCSVFESWYSWIYCLALLVRLKLKPIQKLKYCIYFYLFKICLISSKVQKWHIKVWWFLHSGGCSGEIFS